MPAVRCSSPGVRPRRLTSTALTIGFVQATPVDVCSSSLRIFISDSPHNVGFSLLACGYSARFPTHFFIHQCAKNIINLMRLTVALCMIVDARVLPSGTTLYSASATDKSPVRARHTPTNRTTINHPSGAAMRPGSDPRQSRRTPYPHEFILILFRITEQTPGEAELNPELTARSASQHFPRSTSALPRKPERIHQPGTRTRPGTT